MIVYVVTHVESGRRYVGQTVKTAEQRWGGHVRHARTGRTDMPLLVAIREYGPEAFSVEVVQTCGTQSDLNRAEREWIERLGTLAPAGYNASLGIWRSEGQAAKASATLRGRRITWAAKIGNALRGRPASAEQLARLAKGSAQDRPRSDAERITRSANNGRRVLSDEDVRSIRREYAAGGVSQAAIAARYGVDQKTVSKVVRRVSHAHID